ncbi:family 43 glycosylhydrolase [Streptomyces sp. NPDC003042]
MGGTYHAYATNGDGKYVQHATSEDLTHWSTAHADALPAVGDWADPDRRKVWAPEVFDNGDGFTPHYTARDRAGGKQCIGVAPSSSPQGPFRPAGQGPLVCPLAQGGAIDASSYEEDGRRYLLWKNDGNCCRLSTGLHLQPVSRDGTRITGDPVTLIGQDLDWEAGTVEAPMLVKRDGRYVLLYSAGSYDGDHYKVGYAVAATLTGPYTKAPVPLMTTDSFDGAVEFKNQATGRCLDERSEAHLRTFPCGSHSQKHVPDLVLTPR